LIISNKNQPLLPGFLTPKPVDPLFYEALAGKDGYALIAGVDEAGRGPLAGPVVAAAVIMPVGLTLSGVKDSKKMTERAREKAFYVINQNAIAVGIGVVSHKAIDESNILNASLEAMKQAISYLDPAPEYALIDGINEIPVTIPQRCIKRGDQLSHSISAASIIAKVYRDRIMRSYHMLYPEFGLEKNKGYGTAAHLAALRRYGPSPIHRLTFRGVG
jgi:ribonuclease HII